MSDCPDLNRALAAVALLLSSGLMPAYAQDRFDVSTLQPMPSQTVDYVSTPSTRTLEQWGYELGIFVDHADDPFFLVENTGNELGRIVSRQLTGRVLATLALLDSLQLGVDVPIVLSQAGDDLTGVGDTFEAPVAGLGVGDLRLVPKFRLFDSRKDKKGVGIAMATQIEAWIPIGNEAVYQGEGPMASELGGLRLHPELAIDAHLGKDYALGLQAGFLLRPALQLERAEIDDVLTFGLSGRVAVHERFQLVPELTGTLPILSDSLTIERLDLELIGAARVFLTDSLMLQAGGGVGISKTFDTPDFRILGGLHFAPGNGKDKDEDGILKKVDLCPDEPEDLDGFEDTDGCPDRDNDQDGVIDELDACPSEVEDLDGVADEDGCPEEDADDDGLLDAEDACPEAAEVINGIDDEDGCPDALPETTGAAGSQAPVSQVPRTVEDVAPGVVAPRRPRFGPNDVSLKSTGGATGEPLPARLDRACGEALLTEPLTFDYGTNRVSRESRMRLDFLIDILTQAQVIELIRVEGHTDDDGTEEFNFELSRQRADIVREYLVQGGIHPKRVTAVGFGESRPRAPNDSWENRERNRRVEIIVVQQQGCDE